MCHLHKITPQFFFNNVVECSKTRIEELLITILFGSSLFSINNPNIMVLTVQGIEKRQSGDFLSLGSLYVSVYNEFVVSGMSANREVLSWEMAENPI